jgi:hypothetical protein
MPQLPLQSSGITANPMMMPAMGSNPMNPMMMMGNGMLGGMGGMNNPMSMMMNPMMKYA